MVAIPYVRPSLYPKQEQALFCPQRWALVEASTKSGKTVGCIAWLLEQAFMGQRGWNYWWVAPIAEQARIAFSRIKNGLTPGSFTSQESPTPKIMLLTGQVIWFKSADNPDSLYGEDVYAAVIDEASRSKPDAWHAVRSTLTATRGPCRIIGNVKGRKNWFYEFARRIEAGLEPNGHFLRITAADAVAAGVLAQEEIDDARRNLPENVFRELYMAEPGDDAGNPFGLDHILACVSDGLAAGPVVAWGFDLAKYQDWFVGIGLNADGHVAGFVRWRGVPWRDSIRRVHKLVGEDTPALVDSTGVGDPVLEELQHEHGNFSGYTFSPSSKQRLMEGLAVSIQSHETRYPDGQIRIELENFEYEVGRTGVRYTAVEGHNDDCVCALALARQQWVEVAPGANVMAYYAEQSRRLREREAKLAAANGDAAPAKRISDGSDIDVPIDVGDAITNELTEIYNQTVLASTPSATTKCAFCGEPVTGARVTDGAFVWHPHHAGAYAPLPATQLSGPHLEV